MLFFPSSLPLFVLAYCRDSAWERRLDIRYQDFVCAILFGIGVGGVLDGYRSGLGMPRSNGRVQWLRTKRGYVSRFIKCICTCY